MNVERCQCMACVKQRGNTIGGLPEYMCRMVVCATCGNKRCPRATDHRHACSGSNEPGQTAKESKAIDPPAA